MTEHRAADDHGTTDGPDAERVNGEAATAEGVRSGPESAARPDDRNGRIITFYSYKGGTGRTMALANTAWILASNGFRVLAVDWDLEAPGLARFFEPFLAPEVQAATSGVIDLITEYREEALRGLERGPEWYREFARVRPHAVPLAWQWFEPGGSLDFLSAGRLNSDYSATLASINWDKFYDDLDGGQFFDALRDDMRRNYDYVLIDSRTGLSDIAEICTVQMPDDLVVCFTLSNQSIDGASSIAQHIADRYHDRNIRILPVPMRIDDGEKEKVDAGRALSRVRFDGLPQGLSGEELTRYWGAVEVPYRPFYAYEEILATFGDQSGVPTSMLSAFERLTAVLTDERVTALPAIPQDTRLRYVDSFTRRRPPVLADLYLSYVPEDRMWADWIESVLKGAGFRVLPRDVSAGSDPRAEAERSMDASYRTVAILSPSYVRSPQAQALWESVAKSDPSGTRRQLIPVRVGDVRPTAPFSNRNSVDLVRMEEAPAAAALLRALGRSDLAAVEHPVGSGPRFPGTRPRIWNVQFRNTSFTGRAAALERLRSQLGGGTTVVLPPPQALYGLGGVGKTQVALEYAYRFMADYDLVWWIEAEQPDRVALSLGELAKKLELRVGDNVAEAAEAARDALRRGSPIDRWLLIFDNADDPAKIARYFPGGSGHILVTSRNQAWSNHAEPLEVDVFTRSESIEHLCRQAKGLSRQDANRVAEAVGDLPLAVGLAAAWLNTTGTPVDAYVAQLQQEAVRALALAQQPADYPHVFGVAWNISIERLAQQAPAAARLLELCAYFSADPISMDLFYRDQMIKVLVGYDPDLRDKFMLGKVIQAIGRYGLAKVDPGSNTFQVHRMVQAVIRSKLNPLQQDSTMHEVHDILVGARPAVGDTDDPENWPAFERIWPHLASSRAEECDQADTRQLLLDRVRYLWKRGELDAAEQLGNELNRLWVAKLGEDDRQTLLLRFHMANVLRSQGRFAEALTLDQATLDKQRELLSADHPYTLMTARGLAADLRALGRFAEALDIDKEILDKFKEQFGDEDPQTLSTVNNLAIDYRFTGDYEAARQLDQETLDRRVAVLGPRHLYTLTTKAALAEDLRALGDYRGSVELLEEFQEEYRAVPVMDLPTLRYAKSLAVALRKAGREGEARQITKETYARFLDNYGENAPDTLACALNLAADYSASGDKELARDFAQEVYDGYLAQLGPEHPFTLAVAVNVSIYLRDSGQAEEAVALGEHTTSTLERVVGPDHPFTLTSLLNLANSVGEDGDLVRSEELGRTALAGLVARYGPTHPDVVVCEANLAVTLRASGRRSEAQELRGRVIEELIRQLGDEHPATRACREWRRLGRSLEIQPV
ncbi:FxSxx-COOH system tetratricopeptide repeat protein [Streptacidiphilus albus]|uniref:FxSxx-COOH system tetratricopeptide repeat protein n=1 Tax=Streptacidiphilus albus TaxID=105425 RepID=UPI0009DEDC34|nr:FxSxx-COOH system tetratricopeptide repeat protein [Streptacidiphilus albus]